MSQRCRSGRGRKEKEIRYSSGRASQANSDKVRGPVKEMKEGQCEACRHTGKLSCRVRAWRERGRDAV